MAYQGIAGALGADTVEQLHDIVVGDSGPDLTIILDLPVADGLLRADARGGPPSKEERFESKGVGYQEKVRAAYLDIAKHAPERCIVVDASGDAEAVFQRVANAARKSGIL